MSENYDVYLIDMFWHKLCAKELIKLLTKLIGWIMHLYDELDVDWLVKLCFDKLLIELRKVWIGCNENYDEHCDEL